MSNSDSNYGALDHEWVSLLRRIRLAKGFCFITYFVSDYEVAEEIKARLQEILPPRGVDMVHIAAEQSADLVDVSLRAVFDSRSVQASRGHLYWLEAVRGAGDPEWDAERAHLLSRLNERRSRLEAELDGPLILLLPADAVRDIAIFAPDLWHVRTYSGELKGEGAGTTSTHIDTQTIVMDLALPGAGSDGDATSTARVVATPEVLFDDGWPFHCGNLVDSAEPLLRLRRDELHLFASGDKGFDRRMYEALQCLAEGQLTQARHRSELAAEMVVRLKADGQHPRFRAVHAEAFVAWVTGQIAHSAGELSVALDSLKVSLALLLGKGSRREVPVIDSLGRVLFDKGEFAEALEQFERMRRAAVAERDDRTLAVAHARMAMVRLVRGEYDRAISELTQSVSLVRDLGDTALEAAVLTELGGTQARAGEISEATDRFMEALVCIDPEAGGFEEQAGIDASNLALPISRRQRAVPRDDYTGGKVMLLCRQAFLFQRSAVPAAYAERLLRRARLLYETEEKRRRMETERPMSRERLRLASVLAIQAILEARQGKTEESLSTLANARAIFAERGDERGTRLAAVEEHRAMSRDLLNT